MSAHTRELNESTVISSDRLLLQRAAAFLLDYVAMMTILGMMLVLAIYIKRHWPIFRVDQLMLAPGVLALGTRLLHNSIFANLEAVRIAGGISWLGYLLTAGWAFYNWIYLAAHNRQSLGKYFIGLRVRRVDGRSMGYGTAIRRHLIGYPISILSLGLGLLPILRNGREPGWHDRLAGTVVEIE